jgi:hypothetical protein
VLKEHPKQSYDLMSGLVGFGVYALERMPHPMAAVGNRQSEGAVCLVLLIEQYQNASPLQAHYISTGGIDNGRQRTEEERRQAQN